MASPSTYMLRGITLIEMLIVTALLLVCGGLGLFVSFDRYREEERHDSYETLRAALEKARSQSLGQLCRTDGCTAGTAHGVYLEVPGHYIIFEGQRYETRDPGLDEFIDAAPRTVRGGCREAIFERGTASGRCDPDEPIVLTDADGHVTTVSIDDTGRISWNED